MKPLRIGIIGASTLKGKEIKEALENSSLAAIDIALLDDETVLGKLEQINDEATFIQTVSDETLDSLDIAFFAGDAALTRTHYASARSANCSIVDTTYALQGEPGYPIRSPWLEEDSHPPLDALGAVTAHPLATSLALIVKCLTQASKIRVAAATALQPASETGNAGMDEFHQQTVSLLNFQSLPKAVFDTQVAFNLLQEFGAASASPLPQVAVRIRAHLAAISAPTAPRTSVNLIAAPVFHGYTMSLFVQFTSAVSDDQLSRALNHPHLQLIVPGADPEEYPSNINAAGEDRIGITFQRDPATHDSIWIWAAADNLKLTAITAVECARGLAIVRTSGQVQ
ncbi:MAG: aspartate-semialdehyde dehydrogenase [Acidobacteriaceae bacterium]